MGGGVVVEEESVGGDEMFKEMINIVTDAVQSGEATPKEGADAILTISNEFKQSNIPVNAAFVQSVVDVRNAADRQEKEKQEDTNYLPYVLGGIGLLFFVMFLLFIVIYLAK